MVSEKRRGCESSLRGKQSTDAHRTCNKTCAMFHLRIFFEVERKTAFTKGSYHLTEKKGWGVESIIILVSDLLGYRRSATSVTV